MTRLIRVTDPKPNVNKVSDRSCKTYLVWILWTFSGRRFILLWKGKLLCVWLFTCTPHELCRSNSQDMMKRINRQNSTMICPKSRISRTAEREYGETRPQPEMLIRQVQKTEMQWHEALWDLENTVCNKSKSTEVLRRLISIWLPFSCSSSDFAEALIQPGSLHMFVLPRVKLVSALQAEAVPTLGTLPCWFLVAYLFISALAGTCEPFIWGLILLQPLIRLILAWELVWSISGISKNNSSSFQEEIIWLGSLSREKNAGISHCSQFLPFAFSAAHKNTTAAGRVPPQQRRKG